MYAINKVDWKKQSKYLSWALRESGSVLCRIVLWDCYLFFRGRTGNWVKRPPPKKRSHIVIVKWTSTTIAAIFAHLDLVPLDQLGACLRIDGIKSMSRGFLDCNRLAVGRVCLFSWDNNDFFNNYSCKCTQIESCQVWRKHWFLRGRLRSLFHPKK